LVFIHATTFSMSLLVAVLGLWGPRLVRAQTWLAYFATLPVDSPKASK